MQLEVDRYIALRARTLAYMTGELKLHELRNRAATTLGARFDIHAFHDQSLCSGSLPLDLPKRCVDD
jgi:uncharacterized protein (DUF885 family)